MDEEKKVLGVRSLEQKTFMELETILWQMNVAYPDTNKKEDLIKIIREHSK